MACVAVLSATSTPITTRRMRHPRRDDGELDPVRLCAAATPLAHHAVVAAVSHRTTRATLVLGPGSVHDL
jgi:hypothetical protein